MLRNLLILGRYLLVVPVIGSILLTIGVVLMGAAVIVERAWHLLDKGEFSLKAAKQMSYTVVLTINFFLVGALAYITAVGFYNLLVTEKNEQLLPRIKIVKLKDLEDKIIGVVVAALAVSFLGEVSEATQMVDILHAGTGIALVIGAIFLFMFLLGKAES